MTAAPFFFSVLILIFLRERDGRTFALDHQAIAFKFGRTFVCAAFEVEFVTRCPLGAPPALEAFQISIAG